MLNLHSIRGGLARLWRAAGVAVLLAAGTWARAEPEPESAAPPVREPVIRKIDPRAEKDVMARIRFYRERLPEDFRFRNNFAWARADIPGLRKKEYYAHSRIQGLDGFSSRVARRIQGISPRPARETARFTTLFVDFQGNIGGPNAIPRWFDTEYKILEDIAARLPDPAVKGSILMYTDLEPCLSCRGVMRQFLAIYTNIQMEVLYDWP